MKKKNILIIGSGNRVQKTILPAVLCLKDRYTLKGVYSRKKKLLIDNSEFGKIETITNLSLMDFPSLDIIIVAVTTENVPDVLVLLSGHSINHIVLLLDTPVLHSRHLWATKYFGLFKKVYVSEDYISMTVYEVAKQIIQSGKIGRLRHIYLFHSGYKHHALAIVKNLASADYVSFMSFIKRGDSVTETKITLPTGVKATLLGPRDYSVGRLLIVGDKGFISDYPLSGNNGIVIRYLFQNGHYSGITVSGLINKHFGFKNSYYHKLIDILPDRSLMNNLKIESMIRMLRDVLNKSPKYKYLYEAGIYDSMTMKLLYTFGYFIDRRCPLGKRSFFNVIIRFVRQASSLARICSILKKASMH